MSTIETEQQAAPQPVPQPTMSLAAKESPAPPPAPVAARISLEKDTAAAATVLPPIQMPASPAHVHISPALDGSRPMSAGNGSYSRSAPGSGNVTPAHMTDYRPVPPTLPPIAQMQPRASTPIQEHPHLPPMASIPAAAPNGARPLVSSAAGPGMVAPPLVTNPQSVPKQPPQQPWRPILRALAPAQPRIVVQERKVTNFYDLPAELRIEIYRLILTGVRLQILPNNLPKEKYCQPALVLTSHQVRNEVLPIIHSLCPIRANVTNFNFAGLIDWMKRIPPDQQHYLCKNPDLRIDLCTTGNIKEVGSGDLRKWLQMRADRYRPQPAWVYTGPPPKRPVANELRRRVKRMTEEGKKAELRAMLDAIGVVVG